MANRYWVGSGTWNTSSTTNWSASSGGAGGASVPGAADTAYFDANSGACTLGSDVTVGAVNQTGYTNALTGTGYTIKLALYGAAWIGATTCTNVNVSCDMYTAQSGRTITAGNVSESNSVNFKVSAGTNTISVTGSVRDLDFTGFSGTFQNTARTIFGILTISSGVTVSGGANVTLFAATSGPKTITTNGKNLDFPITFSGVGGAWALQDNLSLGSTRTATLSNGTLDLNGKTMSVGTFATGAGTKNLTFNGGTLACSAATTTAFNNAQPANFSTTAGTGTGVIQMTAASSKTFVGGGSTYSCALVQAGAGNLTISGANTFQDIQASPAGKPSTILFPAGVTTTVSAFTLGGTSGSLISINSSNGTTQASLLDSSGGTVNANYLNISNINAKPDNGTSWLAFISNGNVNSGNNSGWIFTNASYGYDFGPVASGPVAGNPLVIQITGIQVADQSSALSILNTPSLQVADQSAAIAILAAPAPPSAGRRRQYYIM